MTAYNNLILATPNLAAYWKLDETAGSTFVDAVNSQDLTIAGGVTLNQTALASGVSASFNGTTGTAIRSSAVLTAMENTTLEAWFYTTDLTKTRQPIIFAGDGDGPGWGVILNGFGGTGPGGFFDDGTLTLLHGGVAWYTITGFTASVNTPYHLVLTMDGSRVPKVYINGVQVWTRAAIGSAAPAKFCVGCDDGGGFFKGRIDEAAAYTGVMDDSDIWAHYVEGAGTSATKFACFIPLGATGPLNSDADIIYQPDGNWTGTITPTSTVDGTFSPATLTWSGTHEPQTATYTPASTGAKSIAGTDDGSLTDPAGQTYTVVANGFAYITRRAGNSSDPVTWGRIGPPISGDTFEYKHDLIIDANMMVGTQPGTDTNAISCTTGAVDFTVAAGVMLTVLGRHFNDPPSGMINNVILNADSIYEHDSGGGVMYSLRLGDTFPGGITNLVVNGTNGHRAVIRGASPGELKISTGSQRGCNIDLTYLNFLNLGDASNLALAPGVESSQLMDNVEFDTCGTYGNASGVTKDKNVVWSNCRWIRSVDSNAVILPISDANPDTGTRSITNCTFDKFAQLPMLGLTCEDNVFIDGVGPAGATYGGGTFKNFVRNTSAGPLSRPGDWADCYVVVDGSTYNGFGVYTATADIANPHWTDPLLTGNRQVSDSIFDSFGSDGVGDVDYGPNSASRGSYFLRCIGLPDQSINLSDGTPLNAGTLGTVNGWNGLAAKYDHCTWYTSNQGLLALAEGGDGFAGMIDSCRSNAVWCFAASSSGGFNKILYLPTDPAGAVNDMVVLTRCGWNGIHNLNTANSHTNSKPYYDIPFSSSTNIGQHDVVADPQFVDYTRNFSKWVQSIEPTWPDSPALTFLENLSPSRTDYNAHGLYKLGLTMCGATDNADYDGRYNLSALRTYVRNGFAPTNPVYKDAGHDGVTIGAVEMGPPLTQTHFIFRRDDGSEISATALAAEDAFIVQPVGTNVRIRIQADAYRDRVAEQFSLEYRKNDSLDWRKVQ